MADRYWVGGSGTWDASTTTNWATTSGGAGGASAPTSADNAYFDGNSDSGAPFTVTIGTGAVCADVIIGDGVTVTTLDQTMTLAGTAAWSIYGSLYFPATNLTRTFAGNVTFAATTTGHTITTNGVTLTRGTNIFTEFNGVGGEWTLGSALTTSDSSSGANQRISFSAGTLKTANYNITTGGLTTSGASAKTIELGSSTFTALNTGRSWDLNSTTGLTFTAGTSTILLSGSGSLFPNLGGITYYDMTFGSNATYVSLRNGATFNNLTINDRSSATISGFNLSANITVNGTLTYTGSAETRRVLFGASNDNPQADSSVPVIGTPRTITANAVSFTSADFRDIVAAGTASWADTVDMTNCGDCKGNTGITFPASKTVYRIGTGNWSATQWASTSGGSPADANFPLAQDTCVFDANTTTGTHTLDVGYSIGTLSMSAVTSAITLATGTTAPTFYGNVTLDADVTLSGTGTLTFAGQGTTQTITSAGRTFTQRILVDSATGSFSLTDNFQSLQPLLLNSGDVNLNGYTYTATAFQSAVAPNRSVTSGSGGKFILTLSSGTVLQLSSTSTFTVNGEFVIDSTVGGSGTRTFNGTSEENNAPTVNIVSGSDTVLLSPSGRTFKNVNFTGFTGSWTPSTSAITYYGDLTVSSGMTVVPGTGIQTFAKSSGSQTITTNGKTLDFPISKNNAGTLTLADDLTMGSTRTFTLTQGTLDLNSKTLSAQDFSSSNSNTRAIAFGSGGQLVLSGSGTVFNATTGTNLTTTGSGVIDLTSASSKTFAGGGRTYPTLNQGGSGTLSITGANTFANVTNTVQPTTITFPSGVTTSVQDFSVGGTLGNLVTLNASTPGSRAILNRV